MRERILWIPMVVILMAPVVVAIGCMFLEVWSPTWMDLASGLEPKPRNRPSAARATGAKRQRVHVPKFSRRVSHSH